MMKQFNLLIQKQNPFTSEPDINKPSRFRPNPPKAEAVWLRPSMVCEVQYTELTADGVMRHPSFVGLRSDKKATAVILEKAKSVRLRKNSSLHKQQALQQIKKGERKTLLNPSEARQEKKIGAHKITFTNVTKIFWPKDSVTKGDLLNYYYQIAPFILPYLKDRPQSLNRFPNGIKGKSFYQKNMTGVIPDWIATTPYVSGAENKNYMLCQDEASLLYMISLGCIEINPWSSRITRPDNPDWCIIDLDPDKNPFTEVIETALVTHDLLDELGVDNYCKTSGSTGLHIYIPLNAKYSYETSRELGRWIATMVHQKLPTITSIERKIKDRKKKIYIDFLQNRPQATVAAPYSLRPKEHATVSMPLYWNEVTSSLRMEDYTIHNAVQIIRERSNLFKPVLQTGIKLKKIIEKMSAKDSSIKIPI